MAGGLAQSKAVRGRSRSSMRGTGTWRPTLRVAVAAAAIAILTVMAVVTAEIAADGVRRTALSSALDSAQSVVATYVDPALSARWLQSDGARNPEIDTSLERLASSSDIERIIIWTADAQIAYASDPALRGHTDEVDEDLLETLEGVSTIAYGDQAEASAEMESLPLLPEPFLEIYLPIRGSNDGEPIGVYEMYQDAAPIEAAVEHTRTWVLGVALAAGMLLFAVVWLAFAAASRRMTHQNRMLRQRAVRDSLTGLYNHRFLVEQLRRRVERSSKAGAEPTAAVALIDVDSFRLLNAGYGHRAGDEVLRRVASVLAATVPPDQFVGRFGPDEFVLLDLRQRRSAESAEHAVLDTVELIRAALSELEFRFAGSERLPVTVSIGVAIAPRDGRRALELLSVAEAATREAKTGGGSTTRVANQATIGSLAAQNSVFGVFEGLVATVDAKDHYTLHHSEHVTALALFLAETLDLPEEDRRLLRLAGLLHDVGKVGVPDSILRKPGALTADEEVAVQQHVALGDAIVGAVPQLAGVRGIVRHHHERWDGTGYLDRLAGPQIPRLARILAVADAYSAMTTDRPYRKALTPAKALARMAQAAGTQLDPELALAFVGAMRLRLAEAGGDAALRAAFQPGGLYFE
jgi:diguanylate cyclase (GGDEF)-like protein/putative nucleotidyltransferase with HDIG domain